MNQVVKVAKIGASALSTNPNDFVFHSDYNGFKIIVEGIKSVSHNASPNTQTFTQAHGQAFTPFVAAYIKVNGESQVYPPNGYGVTVASSKTLVTNGVNFDYVEANGTNIIFSITTSSSKDIDIKYFVLEAI